MSRRGMSGVIVATMLIALGMPGASTAYAQRVERSGAGDAELDARLDRLLREGRYGLITRDTVLSEGDTIPGPVLVLASTIAIEGVVADDLVAVDANVFLRPGARVEGDVVNIAGGLYPSTLATVRGDTIDRPLARYRVVDVGTGYRIEAESASDRFVLDDAFGFRVPTYDRVDGLSISWGTGYRLPSIRGVEPSLHGWIGYRTERRTVSGGLETRLRRGEVLLGIGADRRTATQDEWIRGDLKNSGSFLLAGNDYRNYYHAERVFGRVEWTRTMPRWTLGTELRAQLEDARSLSRGDPFTLFDTAPYRSNPSIDDGTIASLILRTAGSWIGTSSAIEGAAELEIGETGTVGELSVGRLVIDGEWAMAALWNHILELEWHGQALLPGIGELPEQRWTFVGGSGTLNTFETAQFRGDRVVFLETDYIIPLPERLRLPIVGVPELELLHRVGMAWSRDTRSRPLEQNVGVRLQFFSPYVRVLTNPARPLDHLEFDIGLSWPFDGREPWRRGS